MDRVRDQQRHLQFLILQLSSSYLKVSVDKVKDEDSSHTDEELCGGTKAAQVDPKDPQLLHRLYVRWHYLCGWWDGYWNVFSWIVVARQAILGAHCISGFWELQQNKEYSLSS